VGPDAPAAVRAAGRRIAARTPGPGLDEAGGPALEALADAVADPTGVSLPEGTEPAAVLRLLDRVQGELVRGWGEAEPPPAAAEMLEVLSALERVRAGLEPGWGAYLAARLAAPGGADLVREVAHDLQSPLTSILFLSETLRRGRSGAVSETQQRQLGIIYSAALGLISMANSLIELLRGGDGLAETPVEFSVTQMLDQVRDLAQPVADEKGLALRVRYPRLESRMGHPTALSRVLVNLTTNALKFTDAGYVELAAIRRSDGHLEFSVRDTGKGLSSDAAGALYEPFRPGASAGRPLTFSGSGLGLAICRKLVQAMGAELEYETVRDWGTRFYFVLDLPPAPPR
jgi:signal transduction histidine kinase